MDLNVLVTVVTALLEGGGIGVFIFFLLRSLKKEISSLQRTILEQNKTLEVMERRILETERLGDLYRKMVKDFPDDFDQYKKAISALKDSTISELEKANQLKDVQLKSLTELELKKLEIQEHALAELPKLREQLLGTIREIERRFEAVEEYGPFEKPIRIVLTGRRQAGKSSLVVSDFWSKYRSAYRDASLIYPLYFDEKERGTAPTAPVESAAADTSKPKEHAEEGT